MYSQTACYENLRKNYFFKRCGFLLIKSSHPFSLPELFSDGFAV
jgi:hypothetical protein